MQAQGGGIEPEEGTEAGEGKLGHVCTSVVIIGRRMWTFSPCLSCLLIRLATVVMMPRCLPPGQRNEAGVRGLGKDTHTSLRAGSSSKTPGCRLEKMFPDMFLQGAGNSLSASARGGRGE